MSKNKNEHQKYLESIREIQNKSLISLKSQAEALKASVDSLLKKIDSEGISGYYSINSDCLRYSESVWRNSLRLAELKLLEKSVEESFKKKTRKKTKNELDKDK